MSQNEINVPLAAVEDNYNRKQHKKKFEERLNELYGACRNTVVISQEKYDLTLQLLIKIRDGQDVSHLIYKTVKQYVKRNFVKLLTLAGKDSLIINEENTTKALAIKENLFQLIEDSHKKDSLHAGIRKTHGILQN